MTVCFFRKLHRALFTKNYLRKKKCLGHHMDKKFVPKRLKNNAFAGMHGHYQVTDDVFITWSF